MKINCPHCGKEVESGIVNLSKHAFSTDCSAYRQVNFSTTISNQEIEELETLLSYRLKIPKVLKDFLNHCKEDGK